MEFNDFIELGGEPYENKKGQKNRRHSYGSSNDRWHYAN